MRLASIHFGLPASALAGMLIVATSGSANDDCRQQRPNIVIIVSDDQGWNDVGYHGGDVKTANIDCLASEGVQLDRFYVYPICSLSRATLMTGLSADKTRVHNKRGLPLHYPTLPQAFRDAGYQTWLVGKWHLGGFVESEGQEFYPHNRGFDHFYGLVGGAVDYWCKLNVGSGVLDWQRNGKPTYAEGYTTDLLADEAVKLLHTRNELQPFLLVLSFNAVHQPLQSPTDPNVATRHVDVGSRSIYRQMVESMDSAIGRVLTAIDNSGERDQTLVIFLSDNGGLEGHAASNTPLRGGKGYVFDGGIRVPAIICWPGVLPSDETSRQLMWVADLLPTLAAAAEIDVGGMYIDGINLWPSLRDQKPVPRDGFVINMRSRGWTLVGEHWKLIHLPKTKETLLFRIDHDPSERIDVAGQHAEVVRQLVQQAREMTASGMLQIDITRKGPSGLLLFIAMASAIVSLGFYVLRAQKKRRLVRH
jgi:arylsulfatase A-like enzyme